MEKARLSDVINYEEHISPYRIIEVVSGVGSGKNYWVENVLMEKYHVLLITVKIAARAPFARQNRATVPEERASPYSGKNSMLKYSRHTKV